MTSKDSDQRPPKRSNLRLVVQDTQDNLEEFMLMMAKNADLDCFDILSVTRTDSDQMYTQSTVHPKVSTQKIRIAQETANIIPLNKRARR